MEISTNKRAFFYRKTIKKWIKNKNANILIIAGGKMDLDVFVELDYKNVTISNLDKRMDENNFLPFKWSVQNVENLTYKDNSFDFVVIHAGLHHCFSPHRALLEMYRVAKIGVILFESRDSLVIRIMEKVGLSQKYEHAAVYSNNGKYGGVQNTDIPNFVYRWTEREIEKIINSYAPFAPHHFHFNYGYDLPRTVQKRKKGKYIMSFVYLLKIFYFLLTRVFPKQQNLFACYIEKDNVKKEHFEWLKYKDGKYFFNQEWAENYYEKR